jgi:nitroreductase
MSIAELVVKTRSYRRFDESDPISLETLRELVDLARQTASGANHQPLKYLLVSTDEAKAKLFSTLKWAGALPEWDGPVDGEKPTGYIIMLVDTAVRTAPGADHGIAAQTIMLAAMENGIGGCMLGAINRPKIKEIFDIADGLDIALVLALGKPGEKIVLVDVPEDGNTNYYRDAETVHYVPKRSLDDVIVSEA